MNIFNRIAADEFNLLNLALMLSVVRLDVDLLESMRNPFLRQEVSVGLGSSYNYSGFHDSILNFHRFDGFMPNKAPQERDIFNELFNLGSFSRHSNYHRDIYAYAVESGESENSLLTLQLDSEQSTLAVAEEATDDDILESVTPNTRETNSDSLGLSREDAELIEILWKQDIDLGISREAYDAQSRNDSAKKEIEYENLKNSTDPVPEKSKSDDIHPQWEGLNYTIDTETGEYILQPPEEPSTNELPDNSEDVLQEKLPVECERLDDGIIGYLNHISVEDPLVPEESLNNAEFDQLLNEIQNSTATLNNNESLQNNHLPNVDENATNFNFSNLRQPSNVSNVAPIVSQPPLVQAQNIFDDSWQDVASVLLDNYTSSTFSETAVTPSGNISALHTANSTNITSYHSSSNALNPVLIENATLPIAMQPMSPAISNITSNVTSNLIDQSSFVNAVSKSLSTLTNGTDPAGESNQANFNFDNCLFPFNYNQTSQNSNNQTTGILSGLMMADPDFDIIGMTMNEGGLGGINQTEDKVDVSSDSAVSSMSPERIRSFSDTEWLDSNSETSQQDHHDRFYSNTTSGSGEESYLDFNVSTPSSSNMSDISDQKYYTLGSTEHMTLAQKKYKFYGKRMQQESQNPHQNNSGNEENRDINLVPYTDPSRSSGYESYSFDTQSDDSEGAMAMATTTDSKAVIHPFLSQYNQSQNHSANYVYHNHTYTLPPEKESINEDPNFRMKLTRKQIDGDKGLSRDERRAKELNIPIKIEDIVNLSMDEFNEKISKYDFSETQLTLIRDIRRRGKNKVAAQNCRKRKLDQIFSLEDELEQLRAQKLQLIQNKENLKHEKEISYYNYLQLHDKVFKSLLVRQQQQLNVGQQFLKPEDYSLQVTPEGNVYLAPSATSNMSPDYFSRYKFRLQDRK